MDLVPNHTSDQHPGSSTRSRAGTRRTVTTTSGPTPSPTAARRTTGSASSADRPGSSTRPAASTSCTTSRPRSRTSTGGTRRCAREFDDIVRFWWDRGVAGFRIDVCNMMIKDKELRDNPPATEDDPLDQQFMGVRAVYNTDRPEAHDILRRWRAIADTYEPERLLIGETNVEQLPDADGSSTATGTTSCTAASTSSSSTRRSRPARCAPWSRRPRRCSPTGPGPSGPAPTTTCRAWPPAGPAGDPAKVKLALLLLLTLRGTPVPVPGRRDRPDRRAHRAGGRARRRRHPLLALLQGPRRRAHADALERRARGRVHRARASAPGCPWPTRRRATWPTRRAIPTRSSSCAAGPSRPASASDDLAVGSYRSLPSPEGTWAYARGDGATVLLNMCGDAGATSTTCTGTVAVSTDRGLEGSSVEGALTLAPWSGAVVTAVTRPGGDAGDAGSGRRAGHAPALRAVHDAGPGPHRAAAGGGPPAGRRRARGRLLHHGALPGQGGGDRAPASCPSTRSTTPTT